MKCGMTSSANRRRLSVGNGIGEEQEKVPDSARHVLLDPLDALLRRARDGTGQGLPVIGGRHARSLRALGNDAVEPALVLGYDHPGVVGYLYLSQEQRPASWQCRSSTCSLA